MTDDIAEAKISLGRALTVGVAAVMWVASIAGLYFGLAAKLDNQAEKIAELTTKVAIQESQQRSQERALVELTVTLRAKEVIK